MNKPRTTVSLTDQQVEYLKRKAEALGISVSEYLRRVIDRDRQENAA
jgi:predicted DNA binding CopG/RHH family protein